LKPILIFGLSLMLIGSSSLVYAIDLPVDQLPAPVLKVKAPLMDSENLLILRDSGLGLVVGAAVGIGFIAMSPGGFSGQHVDLQSEALTTGIFVGLAGGILTGLWEVKRNRMLKLSVKPGDFKTQPTSLNTTLTF
jgi:hypothetical protein